MFWCQICLYSITLHFLEGRAYTSAVRVQLVSPGDPLAPRETTGTRRRYVMAHSPLAGMGDSQLRLFLQQLWYLGHS